MSTIRKQREAELAALIREQKRDMAAARGGTPPGKRDGRIEEAAASDIGVSLDSASFARIDPGFEAADEGPVVYWLDDPGCNWLGSEAEDLMYAGRAQCPICADRPKRPNIECPYCHRRGRETHLPRRYPTRTLLNKPAEFQGAYRRGKASKRAKGAKPVGPNKAA